MCAWNVGWGAMGVKGHLLGVSSFLPPIALETELRSSGEHLWSGLLTLARYFDWLISDCGFRNVLQSVSLDLSACHLPELKVSFQMVLVLVCTECPETFRHYAVPDQLSSWCCSCDLPEITVA